MKNQDKGIVILGHPRSGTTLLRRLLNAHSRIACPPETHLLSACARFLDAENTAAGVDMGVLAGLNFAGVDDEVVISKLRQFAFSFFESYADSKGKARWAEKTAFDAFHIDNIDLLCDDNVMFIGIVRHGLDVAISSKDFCDSTGIYPKDMHPYIQRYSEPIEAFCRSWLEVCERLIALEQRRKESCIICRYEDLVEDPERTLSELLSFVGESFEPGILEQALGSDQEFGFGDHKSYQTRDVHRGSVARWRRLPEAQIKKLAPVLNPNLAHFGYEIVESDDGAIDNRAARQNYARGLELLVSRQQESALVDKPRRKERGKSPIPKFYGRDVSSLGRSAYRTNVALDSETARKVTEFGSESTAFFCTLLLAFQHRVTDNEEYYVEVLSSLNVDSEVTSKNSGCITVRLTIADSDSFAVVSSNFSEAISAGEHSDKSATVVFEHWETQLSAPVVELSQADILTLDNDDEIHCEDALRLSVFQNETTQQLILSFAFNSNVFPDRAQRERAVSHFLRLLDSYLTDKENVVSQTKLLTKFEQNLLLPGKAKQSNEKLLPTVIESFAEQVNRRPDHIAIEFKGKRLSYNELADRVWRLSSYLRARGVEADSLVAVCVDRSIEMVTSLLAVMHAGGVYIPLDPNHPKDRLEKILLDSEPQFLITEMDLRSKLGESRKDRTICLDKEPWLAAEPKPDAGPRGERVYIIFTSGSTGRPKGVEVLHFGLSTFLSSMTKEPGLNENDRLLAVTTVSFDIAALELFLPLINGATICLAEYEAVYDARALQRMMVELQITCLQATPSTYQLLLATDWKGGGHLKLLCGGEAFPPDLAESLLSRCGELWNMYGPTETTIWSTIKKIKEITPMLSIGKPIDGTEIYILNSRTVPVPIGVAGELYISGDGLALGYYNRPDLTSASYIENPFACGDERMYKTGDLVRSLDNGDIEYLGRIDNQVKIRGFRIELGEIEAAISENIAVSQCVVGVYELEKSKALVAYIILQEGSLLDAEAIREGLAKKLPNYMIPAYYEFLDSFPLTANNKIDKKALPAPTRTSVEMSHFVRSDDLHHIDNPIADKIVESWKEVFGLDRMSTEESFVSLGGDSLSYVQASFALEDILSVVPGNWEKLKIRELAQMELATVADKKASIGVPVETGIVARVYAILAVVAFHADLSFLRGGAVLMLVIAGANFLRFQFDHIAQGSYSRVSVSIVKNILIPYWGVVIGFSLLKFGTVHLPDVLLFTNFLGERPFGKPFGIWYIQALIQSILLAIVPLFIPGMRDVIIRNKLSYAFCLFFFACCIRVLDSLTGHWGWALNGGQVSWVFWLFSLGILIGQVDTQRLKIVVSMLALGCSFLFYEGDYARIITISIGALFLIWIEIIHIPRFLLAPVKITGASSLFIYMMHPRAPIDNMSSAWSVDVIQFVTGIVLGVVVWKIYTLVTAEIEKFLSRKFSKE